MKFLRRLFLLWVNWLAAHRRKIPSNEAEETSAAVPRALGAQERVSRFIYSKSHLSREHRRPKRQAFDPGKYDDLSTVHTSNLLERQVWEIGQNTVGTQPGRTTIYGRADIIVRSLESRGLQAIRDDKVFVRHTSILGWPKADDPDEQKQKRLQICLQLSQDPEVVLAIPASAELSQ